MGLGDALARLDRRVLGRHADPGEPPRHPARSVALLVLVTALLRFLGLLAMGSGVQDALASLATYLVTVVMVLPLVLMLLRRGQHRTGRNDRRSD